MKVEWLTVLEVASELKVHIETVRRWIRQGDLRAARLGARSGYRVTRAELARFMERRTTALASERAS